MRHISVNRTPYVLFEPDPDALVKIGTEAGFEVEIERLERVLLVILQPNPPRSLFFDASDTRQVSRLAAARTFANGTTGAVYNTPFALETRGNAGLVVRISTEVRWDQARKYPQGACETSLLLLFQQLVSDLASGMVGLCGVPPSGAASASDSLRS